MKLFKTGITFLLLGGISITGCAIKTCPTYSKVPHNINYEKAKIEHFTTKVKV